MSENLKEWIKDLLFAAVLAFIILLFIMPTVVKESSMENTLIENDYLIVMNAYHVGKELLSLGDTVEHTVISYVNAVLAEEIAVIEHVKHTHAELELLLAGVASRHIERQTLSLEAVVESFSLVLKADELFLVHFR